MENDIIHFDEAKEVLRKFFQLIVKDYIYPMLRFSRLTYERESYETAREFINGEIAVQWGDFTLSFKDLCELLELDPDWWYTKIERERIERTNKFLDRGRKKKKDLMSIVCFTNCCSQRLISILRPRLKQTGLKPVFSPINEVEFYNDYSVDKLNSLTKEDETDLLEKRLIIRKQVDRHTLLLSRADLMLVIWTAGINEFQVLMDITTAYRNYLPVFMIMMPDGPEIDLETLALARTVTTGSEAVEKMLTILKDFVGSGRAQIAREVRPKMFDILNER